VMSQLAVGHIVNVAVGDRGPVSIVRKETNSASGSTKFLISHGQATRSTLTLSRVIHFIV
jgi:hypothetical protein